MRAIAGGGGCGAQTLPTRRRLSSRSFSSGANSAMTSSTMLSAASDEPLARSLPGFLNTAEVNIEESRCLPIMAAAVERDAAAADCCGGRFDWGGRGCFRLRGAPSSPSDPSSEEGRARWLQSSSRPSST
uniref:Uncharacterized protein n=1 Tax=Arundo donax TaxID=35708 RepID=A0A0A9CTL1_ARUDO